PRGYIIILPKKTQPFRIFGSEPAKFIEYNLCINTYDRYFRPYNIVKYTAASVYKDCSTPTASYKDTYKLVP
ncbi:hypothetical protein QR685DRAFT_430611, partial [Neurospora intermedia]